MPSPSKTPAVAALPASYSQNAAIAWENVIDAFFKTQNVWEVSDKPLDAIKQMALQLGFTEDTFNTALQDADLFHKVSAMADQAVSDFGVQGTPTFYINGKQITGEQTLDQLSSVIDPML